LWKVLASNAIGAGAAWMAGKKKQHLPVLLFSSLKLDL
jgi:hypothetical protein